MRGVLGTALVAVVVWACTTATPVEAVTTPEANETALAGLEPPAPPSLERPAFAPLSISSDPLSRDTSLQPAPALRPFENLPTAALTLTPECHGAFVQGGLAVCRTLPGAEVGNGGALLTTADARGLVVIGFDRDAPATETLVFSSGGEEALVALTIAARTFREQSVSGLPPQTVTPDEAAQARIARDREHIDRGYASQASVEGFLDGFIWPVEGRISASWGARRIANGVPQRPHYGIDLAVPTGTPIRAPASGVVTLAQPDLLREGGLVMIDHGQGLITLYLHMSRLDVVEGQSVAQGDILGAVGATGRATGPHLCWRMKWRDRFLDPSVAMLGLANARNGLSRVL
jgi:murein DD-endopeptidase MepM/ murein hydrolase activator NlpD